MPLSFSLSFSFCAVNSVEYPDGGFGVLITIPSNKVLVWKSSAYLTYYPETGAFKTVADFDANLAAHNLQSKIVFEYADPEGVRWIVSTNPFFPTAQSGSPYTLTDTLSILVFAKKAEAEKNLDSLNRNIESTTTAITTSTVVIICCTVAGTILLVFLVVDYLARPLESMRRISEEIMEMAAEDEEKKDYLGVIQKAYVNLSRSDEVGILAADYYYIVCLLHNRNIAKKEVPKHPPNPFHLGNTRGIDYEKISWGEFVAEFDAQNDSQLRAVAVAEVVEAESPSAPGTELDMLSAIGKNHKQGFAAVATVDPEAQAPVGGGSTKTKTKHVSGGGGDYLDVPEATTSVGWFTSLKSQLYGLSTVLLVGIAVTMIVTIVPLSRQGDAWMSDSTVQIDNTQVANMQAITFTKSVFVEVAH
jgi:hypothetical protein